jgi:hypothetical protein
MLEGPANPSGMQRAHLKGVTPRRDEKSVEVIDKQRVVRQPSRKRVSKSLKRKDLNERKAKMEVARGEPFEAQGKQAGSCEWQTHRRIA